MARKVDARYEVRCTKNGQSGSIRSVNYTVREEAKEYAFDQNQRTQEEDSELVYYVVDTQNE